VRTEIYQRVEILDNIAQPVPLYRSVLVIAYSACVRMSPNSNSEMKIANGIAQPVCCIAPSKKRCADPATLS
jgi:hypothetical protein